MIEERGTWTRSEPDILDPDAVDVQEHYESHAARVLPELGKIGCAETLGVTDKAGWYIFEESSNVVDGAFTHEGRPRGLTTDFEYILSDVDRALYAVTSYNAPSAIKQMRRCRFGDGGVEWEGLDSPTPNWSDKQAVAAFGDVDLVDELKPRRGDLSETQQHQIEQTLSRYVSAFAELYGGDESAVYALDSVGGAYVFGAPAATLPIAEHYDNDETARSRVMSEFVERSNAFLRDKQQEIEADLEFAEAVIDPDWCNNVNRQYKAPLSLHADHDAVVTPTHTDPEGGVDYSVTWVEDVDAETVRAAREWVKGFTSTEHHDKVSDVVETLWPAYYDGDWRDALDRWLADEREAGSQSGSGAAGGDEYGGVADRATTSFDVVREALDALDIESVADTYVGSEWTDQASGYRDNSGAGKRAFIPTWGDSVNSGTANYVNTKVGSWVDSADYDHGTVVELALIGREDWERGDIAEGGDWVRGVRYLAEDFDEVPELVEDPVTAAMINHAPEGTDPREFSGAALIAWIRARERGALPADASPPRRVLRPIVENLVGIDLGTSTKSVGSATWDHAAAVLEELTEDEAIARYDLPVLGPSDGTPLESPSESINSDSSQST